MPLGYGYNSKHCQSKEDIWNRQDRFPQPANYKQCSHYIQAWEEKREISMSNAPDTLEESLDSNYLQWFARQYHTYSPDCSQ